MILDLGLIDYEEALERQYELVAERRAGRISDSLLMVEHPAVLTIGRTGSIKNLLADESSLRQKGIRVLNVDRGGDITFHCPGQLCLYPIIDLKARVRDLHKYLRDLEEAAISFLKEHGINGIRVKGSTGVWVQDKKIASIGIAAKDWVTYHGLSMNIDIDKSISRMINPCGMKGVEVTSVSEILGRSVSLSEARNILIAKFKEIFGIEEERSQGAYEYSSAMA